MPLRPARFTFARQMPVFRSRNVQPKYIRFQPLAELLTRQEQFSSLPITTTTPHKRGNFYTVRRFATAPQWDANSITSRRTQDGNRFALVPPVHAEVALINGDHCMPGVDFAHANKAKIGQIRFAIRIAPRKLLHVRGFFFEIKSHCQHFISYQRKHKRARPQMERRLAENRFTSQQRLFESAGNSRRPRMMAIIAIAYGHDKTSVGNSFHPLEYPLRDERSGGPLSAPICFMNRCFPLFDLALSSCSRTIRPIGMPVRSDLSFSQPRSSSVRRIVSV